VKKNQNSERGREERVLRRKEGYLEKKGIKSKALEVTKKTGLGDGRDSRVIPGRGRPRKRGGCHNSAKKGGKELNLKKNS